VVDMKKFIIVLIVSLILFPTIAFGGSSSGTLNAAIDFVKQYVAQELVSVKSDIIQLKQENTELRAMISQLEASKTGQAEQTKQEVAKKYYRYFDSQDVFETSTNRHIDYAEAVAKDIWSDIQVVNK